MYDSLTFPNGVALSANNSFILVNESIKKWILKFNMHGPKAAPKIFAKLCRVSNYIKRNKNGRGRLGTIENDAPDPIQMKFNEEAKVLKVLDGKGAPTFNSDK